MMKRPRSTRFEKKPTVPEEASTPVSNGATSVEARVQQALAESEQRYRRLVELSPLPIAIHQDEKIVFANAAAAHCLGTETSEDLVGRSIWDWVHPDSRALAQERVQTLYNTDRSTAPFAEEKFVRADGQVIDVEVMGMMVTFRGRPASQIILRDVTSQKRAKRELAASEARLAEAQRIARLGSWECDLETREIVWSDQLFRILGFDPSEAPPSLEEFLQHVHEEDRESLTAILTEAGLQGDAYEVDYRIVLRDGGVRTIREQAEAILGANGKPVKLRGVSQDITQLVELEAERMQMNERLRQSQKMEALGQLAGGIAHDFNNLLTVILGGLGILLSMEDDPPSNWQRQRKTNLQEARNAAWKASLLTRQLLAFSRKEAPRPKVIAAQEIVADLKKMLDRLIGERIDFRVDLAADVPPVFIPPGHLEQVLLNLVLNASDAMPEGGTLTIGLLNRSLQRTDGELPQELEPGIYTVLSVRDTGPGIPPETMPRIFEPFFTTKPKGEGTGIGLSTAANIVRQAGGHLAVTSVVGRGSTFIVYLPAVRGAAVETTSEWSIRAPEGNETILVCEDEESVRYLVCRALRMKGYTVLEANNGQQALDLFRRAPGPIHLLLSDIVMPKMGGIELAKRVRAEYSHTKVLLISGYPSHVPGAKELRATVDRFLYKPFLPSSLLQTVRALLDG